MNKFIIRLFTLICSFILFTSGANQTDITEVVGFGVVKHNGRKKGGVSVKVFEGKKLIQNMVTTRTRGYGFTLNYNSNYRIVLSKVGYLKQEILINTYVSDEVLDFGRMLWEPDFEICKIMPGLGKDEFDMPVSSYVFDEEYWGFIEDPVYSKQVAPRVNQVKAKLDTLKQIAYLNNFKKGDSLYASGNYAEAILAYNNAKEYTADNELVKKVKTAKKMLKKQHSAEETYTELITEADKLLDSENYQNAAELYEKALVYKPDELYPLDKLYEIDSVQSYAWIEQNDRFDLLVAAADSLMNLVELKVAKEQYHNALNLFPGKVYPKHMITTIDSLLLESGKDEIQNPDSTAIDSTANQQLLTIDSLHDTIADNTIVSDSLIADTSIPPDLKNDESILQDDIGNNETTELTVEMPDTLAPSSEKITETPNTDREKTDEDVLLTEEIVTESTTSVLHEDTTLNQAITDDSADTKTPVITIPSDTLVYRAYTDTNSEENILKLKKALSEEVKLGNKAAEADILTEIGLVYQSEYELGKALGAYSKLLEIKRDLGDKTGEVKALNKIASVMYDSGSYHEAVNNFEQSLHIAQEIDDKEQSSEILESIAIVYENTYRYDEALDKLKKSLEIKEELGDEEAIGELHQSMGNIYYEQNNFDEAIKALEKTASIEARLDNRSDLSATYNSIGAAYYNKNNYKQSLVYYEKSLEQSRLIDDKKLEALTLNNLGNVNYSAEKFREAIEFYQKSLDIKNQITFKEGIAATLHNIGNAYLKLKEYETALHYYQLSQEAAEETKQYEVMWRNYLAFAKTYYATAKYKLAYENYRKYTTSKFEEYGEADQFIELREQYESSKIAVRTLKRELQKQSRIARYEAERNRREMQIVELEIENQRQQINKQRNVILFSVFGFIIILAFSALITRQYRLTNKAYKIVAKQKQDITKGISYAARIQSAVLPPKKYIENTLPEHFILYKPCEVVSGDFYWVGTHFNKTVIAVSDCTGHGVPGGFMSMLGVALLNEIMTSATPLETHDVLTQLRDRIVGALHQQGGDSESLDGMDISLLMLDQESREIQFSAAYHSLYIVRNGELHKIKGDRVPIGYHHKIKPFTSEKEQLQKDDALYMTTDGFTDQIGEETQSRYMLGPFRELITDIYRKPMSEQKEILNTTIENWKGKLPQTDDMLVFGLRV